MPSAPEDSAEEMRKLKRRSERDRKARLDAEAIAERGLRELYETKVQIELLGAIAIAANESSCLEDLLQVALARIGQTTGWTIGHAYIANGRRLISTSIWYGSESESTRAFYVASEAASFDPGVGLPGRVLASGSRLSYSIFRRTLISPGPSLRGSQVSGRLSLFRWSRAVR